MANIFDVAKYILEKNGRMSTWKLQKLCYYCQAWTLAWEARPLFDEDFQAWVNGPVSSELYQEHKGQFMVSETDLRRGASSNLSAEDRENIDIILKDYGDMEPYALRNQTHAEEPWICARGNCGENDRCSNIITKESMGDYYSQL